MTTTTATTTNINLDDVRLITLDEFKELSLIPNGLTEPLLLKYVLNGGDVRCKNSEGEILSTLALRLKGNFDNYLLLYKYGGVELTPGELIHLSWQGKLTEYQVKEYIKDGLDINYIHDEWNWTALEIACSEGLFDIVKALVENGANVHTKDDIAIQTAAMYGHYEMVKYLHQKGADITKVCLFDPCDLGHFDVIKYVLENDPNRNINAQNKYGDFALLFAAQKGHLEIVKLLCEYGADVNLEYENGITAFLASTRYIEVLKYLQSKGANIHHVSHDNQNALIIICSDINISEEKALTVVKYLCENNINIYQEDGYGNALKYSKSDYRHKISNYLKKLMK